MRRVVKIESRLKIVGNPEDKGFVANENWWEELFAADYQTYILFIMLQYYNYYIHASLIKIWDIVILTPIQFTRDRVAQSITSLIADPGSQVRSSPCPNFHGDWSWNNFYCNSPLSFITINMLLQVKASIYL